MNGCRSQLSFGKVLKGCETFGEIRLEHWKSGSGSGVASDMELEKVLD